jgi:deoxyribodipyrimidine photo-lyase
MAEGKQEKMISTQPTSIWWVRRDLRLDDNQALNAACEAGGLVLPVFILDPAIWGSPRAGARRIDFLLEGLRALDDSLRLLGGHLVLRRGEPLEVLSALVAESGAARIFAEADYTPYARRRDAAVAASLPLRVLPGLTVHHPEAVHKADGDPYTVFTPFSRVWKALGIPTQADLLPPPVQIRQPAGIAGLELPARTGKAATFFPAGELEARRRLSLFLDGTIDSYATDRNRPDLDGTSGLSPYFRFGMLSARRAAASARRAMDSAGSETARRGAETWLNELIWREFYHSILYHFPDVRSQSFRASLRDLAWLDDADDLSAWQQGRTGHPIVDAAMRQLLETGWMHNRTRMLAASFLTKDLLVDWKHGERWFMQQLVDGDTAANNGGWQWVAGTGTDAAPYFRIFNPTTQAKKFDPEGAYIRRWIPEMQHVPLQYLYEPWTMPPDVQESSGCRIGRDYPAPIVDHRWARERALDFYKQKAAFRREKAPEGN